MSSTSASAQSSSVPAGTALLGEVLEVPVDAASLSGRRPVVLPDIPVEGYGAETWHAFATLLVARVTELENENDALRSGAMHPTARELLDLFVARIDETLPHLAAAHRSAHRSALTDAIASSTAEPEPAPTTKSSADPTTEPAATDLVVEAAADAVADEVPDVDGLPEASAEDVAAVAGTPEGVEFWDEADTHSLLGRLRRRRRHSGGRGRAATPDGPDGLADAA